MFIVLLSAVKSIIIRPTITLTAIALAAVVAVAPAFGENKEGVDQAAIIARLQHLEDIEAIRLLLDRYMELNESRNYSEYAKLFARDGELVLRRGSATGPAAIEAMLVKNFGGSNTPAPLAGSVHVLSNIKINVSGNTATATSRWTLLVPTEENRPRLGGTGHYGDQLVKEDGVWKFKQRVVYRDIPGDK